MEMATVLVLVVDRNVSVTHVFYNAYVECLWSMC